MHNALPFYWIGQVALLAYQENHPPFEVGLEHNLKPEARFRMVKQWLKHIGGFLKRADDTPTLLWDELMTIRLQSWQSEAEGGGDRMIRKGCWDSSRIFRGLLCICTINV